MTFEAYLPELIGLATFGGLVGARVAILYATDNATLQNSPMEQREYLFETEGGERYNPFSGWSPETDPDQCPRCGHENAEGFHYCSECSSHIPTRG